MDHGAGDNVAPIEKLLRWKVGISVMYYQRFHCNALSEAPL